jgi:hypothetical protein
MKKLIIKAGVAAVAAAFAGSAAAAVNLQTGAGSVAFASELVYSTANPLVGGAGQLALTGNLGFGVSIGATRYIRLTLGNATLGGASGALTVVCGATTNTGTIVQGGAAGDNYAIYQFTAATENCTPTAAVSVANPASLRVASNGTPVTVTYRLHETAVDAVNNTNALFSAGPVNLLTFAAGIKYTVTPRSVIANVQDGFRKFCASAADCSTANSVLTKAIGTVDYGVNTVNRRDGNAVTLADLVTAPTVITVNGDLSAALAAGSVFLATAADGTCVSAVAGVLNAGKTSSNITVDTTAYNRDICYTVNGTTVIQAQTVNQLLDLTAAANTTSADTASAALGTITRNGASTTALNITNPANGDATFVRISNMGTTAGKVTGTLYAEDGSVLGTADATLVATAGAKSTSIFSAAQLATAFGISTWNGRAKLVVIGEFPAGQLRVQNLIRTPNGTLVNVGGDTSGSGN